MKTFNPHIDQPLLERFLRYVQTWTTSDREEADKGKIPSTERQISFARTLEAELRALGINDCRLTEHSYVCARIPASAGFENAPSIGFLAHMDTAQDVSGQNVQPQIIRDYDGSIIHLKNDIKLDPALDSALDAAQGETIITTDGSTLLGADDKAGIAIIISAADALLYGMPEANGKRGKAIPHGQIEIIFSPDEETGHGMDKVPLDWIQSKQCYTLDGGHIGEFELECFTAWKSDIVFTGISRHTGSAHPDMVNAVSMASAFVNLLPQNESPEATKDYFGFYAPMEINGHIEKTQVLLYLRDFTDEAMERRKKTVDILAQSIEHKFHGGRVQVTHTKQYVNMKNKLDSRPEIKESLIRAAKNLGIEQFFKPIRGGTDGSRLTELGIPAPNIFTGGHNFHSRSEWASLNQMSYGVGMILELIKIWSTKLKD